MFYEPMNTLSQGFQRTSNNCMVACLCCLMLNLLIRAEETPEPTKTIPALTAAEQADADAFWKNSRMTKGEIIGHYLRHADGSGQMMSN